MNTDKFTIAVIGGGHAGLELLNKLFTADFIDIVGVADKNPEAPGMLLAKEHHVPITTDMQDLLKDSQQIDIIIDVTGVKAVRDGLRTHMQETGNYHTIIMHERISALLLSLFNGEMVETKASDDFY
ncbi:Oxidoreductase family, NAD-binding Rossmann fold [Oceanospirillum multiglobuliferum]|uniref:Oxidoreductase n=1 Tax=Oceanospirillum multiglobuliferum TaxID=64969 RepID=A0A1T4KVP4_9GAMM|nr:Gfo/Idh/MocA family oxidoreductase [Oceanospirillum multiglobuliferum]OPX54970.1 oxidoreductase [Oceanospirillum multiglobuliferum]SJZ46499.1 Oxidoreductase family, NAD-binding Rossmann fold [Oceanospirillum multiglobuliferum]